MRYMYSIGPCMQPAGGAPVCEQPMVKWYTVPFYHSVFRSPIKISARRSGQKKASILNSQKLLRPGRILDVYLSVNIEMFTDVYRFTTNCNPGLIRIGPTYGIKDGPGDHPRAVLYSVGWALVTALEIGRPVTRAYCSWVPRNSKKNSDGRFFFMYLL
eukprot:SAG11_NODE_180_length_13278_cov_9.158434_8_plen_158_part_00